MADRPFKGHSLLDSLDSYTVVDIETTGFSPQNDEIIEIGAIKVVNGENTECFESLIQPTEPISGRISCLTGITNEDLVTAPQLPDVLQEFLEFVGNDVIVGHNVNFDINFLYDNSAAVLDYPLANNFIDTMQLAQRLFKMDNYKLETLIQEFGISEAVEHRALSDCVNTLQCYEYMKEHMRINGIDIDVCACHSSSGKSKSRKFMVEYTEETQSLQVLQGLLLGITADNILSDIEVLSLKKWLDNNRPLSGNYPFDRVFTVIEKALFDGILEQTELDEMLVLFKKFADPVDCSSGCATQIDITDKLVCLTGEFDSGTRSEIEIRLTQLGAVCKNSVVRDTAYLIVGGQGSDNWKCGNYGGKIKKALEMQDKGIPVIIVRESEFFKALELTV